MKKIMLILSLFLISISYSQFKDEATREKVLKQNNDTTQVDTSKNAIDLWFYRDAEKLKELVENPNKDIWIIDVRLIEEFAKGHIPTAQLFTKSQIENRLNELPKDKYLILYCHSGVRSNMALNILLDNGYFRNHLLNYGGIIDWPYEQEIGM
ncbi:MAG: rhodanese-like domain-containing protein [Candidatus Marinimicrobia bacterium]|nr:rhodanese-like domain-containing protein [Candidatus Neomarinimicrobiota bacterium]